MLVKLLSSRVRVKLLEVFLSNPKRRFYGRELERVTNEHQNAIWRELRNLSEIGLLTVHTEGRLKYYSADPEFPLYDQLRALVFEATPHLTAPTPSPTIDHGLSISQKAYRPTLIVGEND